MRLLAIITLVCAISCGAIAADNKALSGGDLTVHNTSRDAFAKPAPNLSVEDLRKFTFGNKLFNTNWVQAPASVTSLDGLGPVFNRVSCSGCHFKDGRGRPPLSPDEPMNSMLLRLSDKDGNPLENYGDQLNNLSIAGVPAEGKATVYYDEVAGQYPDGEKYSLRKPRYVFTDMAFGELDKDTRFSPRVAPAMLGLGLLEAIPQETLLSYADELDKDNDGISGRPNYIDGKIGRFGWKSNKPSLLEQDTGAALGDIGLTTTLHPNQNCTDVQTACQKAPDGGKPELTDEQVKKLIFYSQTLAVPARRDIDNFDVIRGEALFNETKCSSCHIPKMKTGNTHEVAALNNQTIQPFTDLLLHDMGDDLADNRPDQLANGKEWRTAPLWGIGLVKIVNRHTFLLHDGRARNLEEAILWHGGEAEKSKEKFKNLPRKDRTALIKFLESI